jgi:biopolymer transport protein ExbD
MGLKKRGKVSAEFSMSSLTDIIFLLLIFFMLTSKLVVIDPYELPVSDSTTVAPTNITAQVRASGEIKLNVDGKESKVTSAKEIIRKIRPALSTIENRDNATITIVAEVGVPFKKVSMLMAAAAELQMKAIIATQPTE